MSITTDAGTTPQMEWKVAWSETERVIRQHSKTFYFAPTLLPLPQRLAIRALCVFFRKTDDLVDRCGATFMDLNTQSCDIREALQVYCYHVASTVGLLSIRSSRPAMACRLNKLRPTP